MGALCLPRYLEVFPELAFAALKARDEAVFSAWVAIRAWDSDRDGSGYVARDDFLDSVKQALGVGERQRLRIASAGDGRFWDLTNNGHVRLHSAEAVARMEGVERVSRPHLIRQTEFRGAARRRATLMATAYRTDKLGVPLTRRDIQALTGVAPASQRRLDRDHRQAVRVTPVFACLGPQVSQFYADTIGEEGKGLGFFSGRGKMLFRRHDMKPADCTNFSSAHIGVIYGQPK